MAIFCPAGKLELHVLTPYIYSNAVVGNTNVVERAVAALKDVNAKGERLAPSLIRYLPCQYLLEIADAVRHAA